MGSNDQITPKGIPDIPDEPEASVDFTIPGRKRGEEVTTSVKQEVSSSPVKLAFPKQVDAEFRDKPVARSIYFASEAEVQTLNGIAKRFPGGSVSRIVQQLVAAFNNGALETAPESRVVVLKEVTVYL